MYRFAYWDDGPLANINPNVQRLPYQHWYVNHVVTASGGQAGVRWYEFRAALHTATLSNVSLYPVWHLRSRLQQPLDGFHGAGQDGQCGHGLQHRQLNHV